MNSRAVILIPARMESTRFPGKPLAPIQGTPLVVFCAKNAKATGLDTIVCTDSEEIKTVCDYHDVRSIVTPECNTGTDRIAWCAAQLEYDFFINLQGDEPLITNIDLQHFHEVVVSSKLDQDTIFTGVSRVGSDLAFDPNNVKCVMKEDMSVLYFSRKPLKSLNDNDRPYYKQLGLYGMRKNTLLNFSAMNQSALELIEKVELQRWVEAGRLVKGCDLNVDSISVDTPSDFVAVLEKLNAV